MSARIYHVWCLRILPIHLWGTANEGIRLCIKIYKDHPARPAYYYPLEKITPLPPKFTMDQKELWQHVWRNNGFIWLASNFKERYRNHQTSFRQPNERNETELSKHIWNLKDRKESFHVKWRILRTCKSYNNENKKCNLCLQEKHYIIFRKDLSSLNKRNELASSCRHRNRFTLKFFRIT